MITVKYVTEVLESYGHIDEGLKREIEAGFARRQARMAQARRQQGDHAPSAAQVVGSMDLRSVMDKEPLTEDLIMELVARQVGYRYEKIDPLKIETGLLGGLVSRPFARRQGILPLRRQDGRLELAVADPFGAEVLETIEGLVGMRVTPVIASLTDIEKTITTVMGFKKSVEQAAREVEGGADIGNLEQLFNLADARTLEADDRHVVTAVDYLLGYAFDQRATDIHIEPLREQSQVKLRIDGVLHVVYTFPKAVHQAMVNRVKTMSRLDIAERRRPQDGRLKTKREDGAEIELRVSTLWTAFGEKLVLRIFDAGHYVQGIDQLGMYADQFDAYTRLLSSTTGIILVTGPTGSGKTTTLYSTLKHIHTPGINITTIEDPIEMVIEDFSQVAVHRKIGMDFANALKHILRQDPDIIMVGEIRDEETAQNAVEAALTGHLVFATLHTNDAVGAVIRLEELGIKRYLISSTLRGVVAQRLARKICSHCAETMVLEERHLRLLNIPLPETGRSVTGYTGTGCVHCRHTGYHDRTGIFEIMEVTDRLARMIKAGADARELLSAARQEGLSTLKESGVRLVADGVTDVDEVIRVLAMTGEW